MPDAAKALQENNVELQGDRSTRKILGGQFPVGEATEEDWQTEYRDLILSINIVEWEVTAMLLPIADCLLL
ncbi:MAG: hypothetical protein F6J93_35360 [Oscillatoria sp. SIO1A7]|nr:hypothetical protein [Oscillatoria sp. SIO1A7]